MPYGDDTTGPTWFAGRDGLGRDDFNLTMMAVSDKAATIAVMEEFIACAKQPDTLRLLCDKTAKAIGGGKVPSEHSVQFKALQTWMLAMSTATDDAVAREVGVYLRFQPVGAVSVTRPHFQTQLYPTGEGSSNALQSPYDAITRHTRQKMISGEGARYKGRPFICLERYLECLKSSACRAAGAQSSC